MEPDFVSAFNSCKICHISSLEHDHLSMEQEVLSSHSAYVDWYAEMSRNRGFVQHRDQHFVYCNEAFKSILAIMPSGTYGIDRPPPIHPVWAYVYGAYQRMLTIEPNHRCGRESGPGSVHQARTQVRPVPRVVCHLFP